MFVNFKEVKETISIELAMVFLNLKGLTPEDGAYRGECTVCRAGSRSLVITPEKSAFYCHAAKKGGDVISLVAHLHGTSMKEAASWLLERSTKSKKPERPEPKPPKPTPPPTPKGFTPLKDLRYEHEAVQSLGLTPHDAERMGVGYCFRGYYKGHVVAPIRLEDGHLVVYAIISKEKKMPETLHWPESNVVPLSRKRA